MEAKEESKQEGMYSVCECILVGMPRAMPVYGHYSYPGEEEVLGPDGKKISKNALKKMKKQQEGMYTCCDDYN